MCYDYEKMSVHSCKQYVLVYDHTITETHFIYLRTMLSNLDGLPNFSSVHPWSVVHANSDTLLHTAIVCVFFFTYAEYCRKREKLLFLETFDVFHSQTNLLVNFKMNLHGTFWIGRARICLRIFSHILVL